jgi:hypothetical protein
MSEDTDQKPASTAPQPPHTTPDPALPNKPGQKHGNDNDDDLEEEIEEANEAIIDFLNEQLQTGSKEVLQLRRKLGFTYWVIVALSTVMFLVGIGLIGVPLWRMFTQADSPTSFSDWLPVLTGFADLAMLFLSGPIKRIHNLMGDMAQLTLAINSFRYQLGLHLLGFDAESPESCEHAADVIAKAASNSMELIDKHFEIKTPK